jgi:hypothetical protein
VPLEATKASTRPPVCSQISGPVDSIVRAAVRRVVELVRPDGVRQFLRQPHRLVLVLRRVAVRDDRHLAHLGAERLDQAVLLGRLVVRHHDDAAVAARVADVREADAGVAGRALDDGAARLQRATALGVER